MLKLEVKKENGDGTADVIFDYDNEFIALYKKETGKEVIDNKEVGKYITEMLYSICSHTPNTPTI